MRRNYTTQPGALRCEAAVWRNMSEEPSVRRTAGCWREGGMKSGRETLVTFPTPLLSSMCLTLSLPLSLSLSLSLSPPALLSHGVPLSRSLAAVCVQRKLSLLFPWPFPAWLRPPTTHTHTHTHTQPKNLSLISATMLRVVSARRVHTARSGGSAQGSPPSTLWLIVWSVRHGFSLLNKQTNKQSSENAPEGAFLSEMSAASGFGAALSRCQFQQNLRCNNHKSKKQAKNKTKQKNKQMGVLWLPPQCTIDRNHSVCVPPPGCHLWTLDCDSLWCTVRPERERERESKRERERERVEVAV